METDKISLKGKVIWFFGMCSAGKTTLADMLAKELISQGHKVERLDGDIVRPALCKDLGFSRRDVSENIRRVAYIADILSKNGITVIASFITPNMSNRFVLKDKLGIRLILVHVLTSVKECMKRDTKGLWVKALAGDITDLAGLDVPFEPVDYSGTLTVGIATELRTEKESHNILIDVLRFWGYEV